MTNCQKKSLEGWLLKCADNGLQMRLGLIIGVPSWEGTAHCLLTFRWVHFHSYVLLQSVCPCDETHLFFFPLCPGQQKLTESSESIPGKSDSRNATWLGWY